MALPPQAAASLWDPPTPRNSFPPRRSDAAPSTQDAGGGGGKEGAAFLITAVIKNALAAMISSRPRSLPWMF